MQTNIKHSYLYWHRLAFSVNRTEPRPDGLGLSLSLSLSLPLSLCRPTRRTRSCVVLMRCYLIYVQLLITLTPPDAHVCFISGVAESQAIIPVSIMCPTQTVAILDPLTIEYEYPMCPGGIP